MSSKKGWLEMRAEAGSFPGYGRDAEGGKKIPACNCQIRGATDLSICSGERDYF